MTGTACGSIEQSVKRWIMQTLESTDSDTDVSRLIADGHAMARDCIVWLHLKIQLIDHMDKYLLQTPFLTKLPSDCEISRTLHFGT